MHFTVPVLHNAGRAGADFLYDLTYDSSVWYPATVGSSKVWTPYSNGSYWGWNGLNSTARPAILTYSTTITSSTCGLTGTNHYIQWMYSNYVYTDENRTHPFGYTNYYIQADNAPGCPPTGPPNSKLQEIFGAGRDSQLSSSAAHSSACRTKPIWFRPMCCKPITSCASAEPS